tara:strand:- start:894 stop:1079 length:186 start_codon:yes stop_codon:yes gene_type:complete
MNISSEFEKLLAEGVVKNVFTEEHTRQLETALFEYESSLKCLNLLMPYMAQLIKLREYEAA